MAWWKPGLPDFRLAQLEIGRVGGGGGGGGGGWIGMGYRKRVLYNTNEVTLTG